MSNIDIYKIIMDHIINLQEESTVEKGESLPRSDRRNEHLRLVTRNIDKAAGSDHRWVAKPTEQQRAASLERTKLIYKGRQSDERWTRKPTEQQRAASEGRHTVEKGESRPFTLRRLGNRLTGNRNIDKAAGSDHRWVAKPTERQKAAAERDKLINKGRQSDERWTRKPTEQQRDDAQGSLLKSAKDYITDNPGKSAGLAAGAIGAGLGGVALAKKLRNRRR